MSERWSDGDEYHDVSVEAKGGAYTWRVHLIGDDQNWHDEKGVEPTMQQAKRAAIEVVLRRGEQMRRWAVEQLEVDDANH